MPFLFILYQRRNLRIQSGWPKDPPATVTRARKGKEKTSLRKKEKKAKFVNLPMSLKCPWLHASNKWNIVPDLLTFPFVDQTMEKVKLRRGRNRGI
jgi:hypothetical protein